MHVVKAKRFDNFCVWAFGISMVLLGTVVFTHEFDPLGGREFLEENEWLWFVALIPIAAICFVSTLGACWLILHEVFESYHRFRTEGDTPTRALITSLLLASIIIGLIILALTRGAVNGLE